MYLPEPPEYHWRKCLLCHLGGLRTNKGWHLRGIEQRIRHSKPKTPYQLAHPSSQIGGCKYFSRNERQIGIVHECVPIHSGSEEGIGEAALVHHVNGRVNGRDIIPWLYARGICTSRSAKDIRIVSFRQGDGRYKGRLSPDA